MRLTCDCHFSTKTVSPLQLASVSGQPQSLEASCYLALVTFVSEAGLVQPLCLHFFVTMRYCCVPSCRSRTERIDANVSFHEIPSDDVLRAQWLEVIGRKAWPPSYAPARSTVCSKHFLPEDFKEGCKRRTLKKGAVPSIMTACAPRVQAASSPEYWSSSLAERPREGHELHEDGIPNKITCKEEPQDTCDELSIEAAGETFNSLVPCITVGHVDVTSSLAVSVPDLLNTPHGSKPPAAEPWQLNAVPVEMTSTADVPRECNLEPASPSVARLPVVNAALKPTTSFITAYCPQAMSAPIHVLSLPGCGRAAVNTASVRQNETPLIRRSYGSQTDSFKTNLKALVERQKWKRKVRALQQKISTLTETMERYKEEVRKLKEDSGMSAFLRIVEASEENDLQASFLHDQVKNYGRKRPLWSEVTIKYSTILRSLSAEAYEYLRSECLLRLPCRTTLQTGTSESRPGKWDTALS